MTKQNKHKFIFTLPNGRIKIEASGDANISTLCQAFEDYLKACGYSFDGHIELIKDGSESDIDDMAKFKRPDGGTYTIDPLNAGVIVK